MGRLRGKLECGSPQPSLFSTMVLHSLTLEESFSIIRITSLAKNPNSVNIILNISSVNVFIYCTVGKQFKEILKRSLRRKIMRKSDDLGSVSEGEKTEGMEISRTMTPTMMTTY